MPFTRPCKATSTETETPSSGALASDHLRAAMLAVEAGKKDAGLSLTHRAAALAELGRAVALDPSNEDALGGMVSLLLMAPSTVPPEVRAEIDVSEERSKRLIARAGLVAFSCGLGLVVLALLSMGIREWPSFALMTVLVSVAAITCARQMRKARNGVTYSILLCVCLGYMILTRAFGPLIFVPALTMATALVYAMHPDNKIQRIAMVTMVLATLLPLALELLGIVSPSYVFRDNQLIVVSRLCTLSAVPTLILLAVTANLTPLWAVASIRRIRNALTIAEERLAVQAWHLRQLVPEQARDRVNLGTPRAQRDDESHV